MDGGTVVCVENKATIKITKKGDGTLYTPSFPKDSPAMGVEQFTALYKDKHFTSGKAPADKKTSEESKA